MLSIKAAPSSVSCSRRSACSVPHIHRVEQRVVKANVLGMSFNNAQNPMADAAKRSDVVRTGAFRDDIQEANWQLGCIC